MFISLLKIIFIQIYDEISASWNESLLPWIVSLSETCGWYLISMMLILFSDDDIDDDYVKAPTPIIKFEDYEDDNDCT